MKTTIRTGTAMTSKTLGQIAFERYWKSMLALTGIPGEIPVWADETDEIKAAWEQIGTPQGWGVSIPDRVPTSVPSLMRGVTDDPSDPRLTHGVDAEPVGQAPVYLVLSDAERAKGFVRPLRNCYVHKSCDVVTTMSRTIAETYARDPKFYGSTYCARCCKHLPVSEFLWDGTTEAVGS